MVELVLIILIKMMKIGFILKWKYRMIKGCEAAFYFSSGMGSSPKSKKLFAVGTT